MGVAMELNAGERFVPKGAIAFFLALVVLYALLWFGMYVELIGRH